MQDAEMETVAPQDHGALHQHKGVLWAPPEEPAGSGAEEVCVHVHVHVREHGQLTDSTGWEAQGRRERRGSRPLAPTARPSWEEMHFLDGAPAAWALLSPCGSGETGIGRQGEL